MPSLLTIYLICAVPVLIRRLVLSSHTISCLLTRSRQLIVPYHFLSARIHIYIYRRLTFLFRWEKVNEACYFSYLARVYRPIQALRLVQAQQQTTNLFSCVSPGMCLPHSPFFAVTPETTSQTRSKVSTASHCSDAYR